MERARQILQSLGELPPTRKVADVVELSADQEVQEDPINASDRHGWTRLHLAAMAGDLSQVRELIEAGADINAKEKLEGWTPLKVAQVHKNNDVAILLKERGGV